MLKTFLVWGLLCFQIASLQCQTHLSDSTKLQNYTIFKKIRISVPVNVIRDEKSAELLEDLGETRFNSKDDLIEIQVRKRDGARPLAEVKSMSDDITTQMGIEILESKIIKTKDMDIFYSDGRGPWNGQGKTIGIFRIYFNVKKEHYSFVMKYPASDVDNTKKIKEAIIHSISIK